MVLDLPLPVHVLLRRAHNAKSPKDRHDTAYFAWEVSVRLAVAAHPPDDVSKLARGSMGSWIQALTVADGPHDNPALLAAFGLFTEIGTGRRATPQSVGPRQLLGALAAYRNRVIGHGSARSPAFYDDAALVLISGLEAVWERHLLLPGDARLLYVESVEMDPLGQRRARLIQLSGDAGRVLDPRGTAGIPDDLWPGRLYSRESGRYLPLYPWILFHEEELRERLFFFNGLGRRAEALDYASGDILRGAELDEVTPGAEQDMFAIFNRERAQDEAPPAEDPNHYGGYRILGKLGEGGMGVVYLAEQESLHRLVALKMLPAELCEDATALARFRREVAALSRCDHPNVIKILASGTARGIPYYAMEYVEGTDLSRVARALGGNRDFDTAVSTASEQLRESNKTIFSNMPPIPRATGREPLRSGRDRNRQLARALRDAARGVGHLHDAGVVHRDLKPGNLMVTAADHRIVVMDLGLALISNATRSITRNQSQVLGTLRYMPPEQLQRNLMQVDRRADVYSLGATFYELLTDRPFLDGNSEARLIEQVLHEHPVLADKANPHVSADLGTILGKATAKDPNLRYDTADAFAEDVDAFLKGRPITARPPTLLYLLKLAVRRNKAIAATVAAFVLLVIAGTGAFMLWLDAARREAEEERNAKAAALVEVERQRSATASALRETEIERDAKAEALDRVLRLADAKKARDLLRGKEQLWPVHPDRAAAMRTWLESTRAVLANRSGHEERLVALRAKAIGRSDGEEGPWKFASAEEDWQHQVLSDLVSGLDALGGSGKGDRGAVGEIEERMGVATRLRADSIEAYAEAWGRTIEAIADRKQHPAYAGARIRPQPGLVPLGMDPVSGLFEFGHVGSGSLPRRNPETGRLELRDDFGVILVLVPGGSFRMGAQREDATRPNHDAVAEEGEKPVHRVTVTPFFMSKYELTQSQWAVLTGGDHPSGYKPSDAKPDRRITPRNPVEQVSWNDCTNWLRRYRLALPTEAQWEYACRAGTSTPYCTGAEAATLDGSVNVADAYLKAHGGPPGWRYAEDIDDGHVAHAPVGTFRPNAFGLHDVHGNVWEWCRDTFTDYESADAVDPVKTGPGARVARGGSWGINVEQVRSSFRNPCAPGIRDYDLGVRPSAPLTGP